MAELYRKPQSPPRFFLDAPKQPRGECYVLNRHYMEMDLYCTELERRIKAYEELLGQRVDRLRNAQTGESTL